LCKRRQRSTAPFDQLIQARPELLDNLGFAFQILIPSDLAADNSQK
jgi:hypothetical protein